MIKVFYCKKCNITYYLTQSKNFHCRCCNDKPYNLDIAFSDFTVMNPGERKEWIELSMSTAASVRN